MSKSGRPTSSQLRTDIASFLKLSSLKYFLIDFFFEIYQLISQDGLKSESTYGTAGNSRRFGTKVPPVPTPGVADI